MVRYFSIKSGTGTFCQLGRQKLFDDFQFRPGVCSRFIVRVRQRIAKELTARVTNAAQVDLCFGDLACEFSYFGGGSRASNFAGKRGNLLRY